MVTKSKESIIEGKIYITASDKEATHTLASVFAVPDDNPIFKYPKIASDYHMEFNQQGTRVEELDQKTFTLIAPFTGKADPYYRYSIDRVINWATDRLMRLPYDMRQSILRGNSFELSFEYAENGKMHNVPTYGLISWVKPLNGTDLHNTYIRINRPIP